MLDVVGYEVRVKMFTKYLNSYSEDIKKAIYLVIRTTKSKIGFDVGNKMSGDLLNEINTKLTRKFAGFFYSSFTDRRTLQNIIYDFGKTRSIHEKEKLCKEFNSVFNKYCKGTELKIISNIPNSSSLDDMKVSYIRRYYPVLPLDVEKGIYILPLNFHLKRKKDRVKCDVKFLFYDTETNGMMISAQYPVVFEKEQNGKIQVKLKPHEDESSLDCVWDFIALPEGNKYYYCYNDALEHEYGNGTVIDIDTGQLICKIQDDKLVRECVEFEYGKHIVEKLVKEDKDSFSTKFLLLTQNRVITALKYIYRAGIFNEKSNCDFNQFIDNLNAWCSNYGDALYEKLRRTIISHFRCDPDKIETEDFIITPGQKDKQAVDIVIKNWFGKTLSLKGMVYNNWNSKDIDVVTNFYLAGYDLYFYLNRLSMSDIEIVTRNNSGTGTGEIIVRSPDDDSVYYYHDNYYSVIYDADELLESIKSGKSLVIPKSVSFEFGYDDLKDENVCAQEVLSRLARENLIEDIKTTETDELSGDIIL